MGEDVGYSNNNPLYKYTLILLEHTSIFKYCPGASLHIIHYNIGTIYIFGIASPSCNTSKSFQVMYII